MRLTKFTAGLIALSIAVSGFAAVPARAGNEDVAKVIGGLLTLYVIGKAIDDNKSKKSSKPTLNKEERKRRVDHTYVIPKACVTTAKSHYGKSQLIAFERCLKRERLSKAPLPRACETRVRTRHGGADAYDLGCLTNYGYKVRDASHKYPMYR